MNFGSIVCLLMSGIFLILAIVFMLIKEKGAVLISGFNSLSKDERNKYDQTKMSKDMRNLFLMWFAIFAIGAILSYLVSAYIAIVSFVFWLILLIKNLHLDTEKAFEKYRLEDKVY